MNEPSLRRHSSLGKWEERQSTRQSRIRLFSLFILFDALLIVAVLLSFQGTELIEQEVILQQTREVYETQIVEQVFTKTIEATVVMPYGWVE